MAFAGCHASMMRAPIWNVLFRARNHRSLSSLGIPAILLQVGTAYHSRRGLVTAAHPIPLGMSAARWGRPQPLGREPSPPLAHTFRMI